MEKAVVVSGRLTSPTTVELDEAVPSMNPEVQVILRPRIDRSTPMGTVFDLLRNLPPGTCSKDEIDQRLQVERDSWGER